MSDIYYDQVFVNIMVDIILRTFIMDKYAGAKT
jgi:hypothetical protein